MKTHQVLVFCFLSALQDGNSGLSNAVYVFGGAEGGKGSMTCTFRSPGNTMFFCKGECKDDGILIKTEDSMARSGRFSVRYEDGPSGRRQVTVTITQLNKSDAGGYICGLGGSSAPDVYDDFHLMITDEATLGSNDSFILTEIVGGNVTVTCRAAVHNGTRFFCRGECTKEEDTLLEIQSTAAQGGRYAIEFKGGKDYGLHVTIRQLQKSDTGWYKCGYGNPLSPLSVYSFPIIVVDAPPTPAPKRTPAPVTTSVPSASTSPTQNLPETTNRPKAAAATTEESNWTLQTFPPSVPSASTAAAQSLTSSSGSFTPSSPEPTEPTEPTKPTEPITGSVSHRLSGPAFVLPLVVCVLLAAASGAVLLYKRRKRRDSDLISKNVEVPVIYEKLGPVPKPADSSCQIRRD